MRPAVDWHALAVGEHRASREGGARWRQFVREAEAYTALPWSRVRVELDPYVRGYLAAVVIPEEKKHED